jgi:hypothetical protein
MSRESRNFGGVSVSQLEHRASRFFYSFDYARNQYDGMDAHAYYSPGADERLEEGEAMSWRGHLHFVAKWAANLARELDEPDLWMTADSGQAFRTSSQDQNSNAPFRVEERRQVHDALQAILTYVKDNKSLSQEQLVVLDARLSYLDEATERLGKFDWRGVALSTLINIAWDLAFAPDEATHFLARCAAALAAVLKGLPQLGG